MIVSVEMPIEGVEWRVLSDHPDYEVSEFGHFRRCRPNKRGFFDRRLFAYRLHEGYDQYTLNEGQKRKKKYAHRMVAEAFVGPVPFFEAQVRHLDGGKRNHHYSNLKWGTPAENQADRKIHGTDMRGEDHTNAKLTAAQVVQIRRLASLGIYHEVLAEEFHVARQSIGDVVTRKAWAHVA